MRKQQMRKQQKEIVEPARMSSYFKMEFGTLAVITVSGILYNAGMTAGPWFEGKLAQYLCDILGGTRKAGDMAVLAFIYLLTILAVQAARYVKRLYVRKFGNNVNREMKKVLYHCLVHKRKQEFETESVGAIMTKAISDVDTCVEGMRKFTTEIFDTGVVMAAYLIMLFFYDWRLTLLSLIFPPIAYIAAERLKKMVTKSAAAYKESAGNLNSATLDRVSNAITYRVYGREESQRQEYETYLRDYEKKAVKANIWETAMQPLYQMISMMGVLFILWFGGKNVMGSGWNSWDIAAFTTFLSCFTKLATKASKSAKLFNAVQKASVSWKRIRPFMQNIAGRTEEKEETSEKLMVSHVSFCYPDGNEILKDISFSAKPGEIIGITGPVASGKSTLGRIFLCEYPYEGSILFGGQELSEIVNDRSIVAYMGHQPELIGDTIEENILLGKKEDALPFLKAVCMEKEVEKMTDGIKTILGDEGSGLSGGQQARIALARTICHKKPILILDDPFSAVDKKTEYEIMENLKQLAGDSIILLLSHRLNQFPLMDQVIWLNHKKAVVATHEKLIEQVEDYRKLYFAQVEGGGENEV